MPRGIRSFKRQSRWLGWQPGEFVGLLLCLLLVLLLVPLVPLMRTYERARRFYEGDGDE